MTQAIGLGMIVLTASTLRGEPAWLEHICVSHLQHDSQAKVLRDHATFVASRGTEIRTQLLRTCTQCLPTHSYLSRPNYLVLALSQAQQSAPERSPVDCHSSHHRRDLPSPLHPCGKAEDENLRRPTPWSLPGLVESGKVCRARAPSSCLHLLLYVGKDPSTLSAGTPNTFASPPCSISNARLRHCIHLLPLQHFYSNSTCCER